jgi:competence protein ComEA
MSRSDRILVASGLGALVLAAAAVWVLVSPTLGTTPELDGDVGTLFAGSSQSTVPSGAPSSADRIVVDVQGGVAEPGVRELPTGSRVGDAIAAAGGYAMDADLAAAAAINLAEPLVDGSQIRVPRVGDAPPPAPSTVAAPGGAGASGGAGGAGGGAAGGPVNLNTATPEQLEALPGIGPVTVQKIVAARAEQPFASLEDAMQRGVINRGQLEDIQGLATAG